MVSVRIAGVGNHLLAIINHRCCCSYGMRVERANVCRSLAVFSESTLEKSWVASGFQVPAHATAEHDAIADLLPSST